MVFPAPLRLFGDRLGRDMRLIYPAHARQQDAPAHKQEHPIGDTTMSTCTKIALAAALILGSASATLANDASRHGRLSYAQAHLRPSPNVDPNRSTQPTVAGRPLTAFERSWFDYQDHE
jgi:hypothetical protein